MVCTSKSARSQSVRAISGPLRPAVSCDRRDRTTKPVQLHPLGPYALIDAFSAYLSPCTTGPPPKAPRIHAQQNTLVA